MTTTGKVIVMTFADRAARNAALSSEVQRSHEAVEIAQLTIDKMKVELTYLRRMKYGRSSEKLEHAQLDLVWRPSRRAAYWLMPDYRSVQLYVYALHRSRKYLAPQARLLVDFLVESFSGNVDRVT